MLPIIAVAQMGADSSYLIQPDMHQIGNYLQEFDRQLSSSIAYGLNRDDYDFDFIRRATENRDTATADTAAAKMRILRSMNQFYEDLFNGRAQTLSYSGLRVRKNIEDVRNLLYNSLKAGTISNIARGEISDTTYKQLKAQLLSINDSVSIKSSVYKRKLRALYKVLETYRWIYSILKNNEFSIVVNIPSATLLLFHNEQPVFESKVIVGKRTTRTPTMVSMLTDITIFPYWNVPKSIATKELLPEIKKDLSYINRNSFQLLDQHGRIVNPSKIPWSTLDASNFPYSIRQSTGCDNSLGLIKLNINNPFNIYLHDTPWKSLFASGNRFFSHGCVRVEKAKELAHILLNENSIAVDTLDEKASLLGREPTILKLSYKVPVLILYNTAWFDIKRNVRFYSDVYSKLQ